MESVLNRDNFASVEDYYFANAIEQNIKFYGENIVNTLKANNAIKSQAINSWYTSDFDASSWEYEGKDFSFESL